MGLLARVKDLAKTAAEHEADEIHAQTRARLPESEVLVDRQVALVSGVVRAVTMPNLRAVQVLVAELFDGRQAVNLVWIGRRRIPGIEPGALLCARGRVAMRGGVPTIFNPIYTIAPK